MALGPLVILEKWVSQTIGILIWQTLAWRKLEGLFIFCPFHWSQNRTKLQLRGKRHRKMWEVQMAVRWLRRMSSVELLIKHASREGHTSCHLSYTGEFQREQDQECRSNPITGLCGNLTGFYVNVEELFHFKNYSSLAESRRSHFYSKAAWAGWRLHRSPGLLERSIGIPSTKPHMRERVWHLWSTLWILELCLCFLWVSAGPGFFLNFLK